jgi:ankyrin repeat protein
MTTEHVHPRGRELLAAIESSDDTRALALLAADPSLAKRPLIAKLDFALHIASWQGRVQLMRSLIKLGAPLNGGGDHGRTPLHYAVLNGEYDAAELLLTAGADPTIRDEDGLDAVGAALRSREGSNELVALIRRHHPKVDTRDELLGCVRLGDARGIARILSQEPDAVKRYPDGPELLEEAIGFIDDAILEADTEIQADIDRVARENMDVLNVLLRAGISIEDETSSAMPAVLVAAQLSTDVVLRRLVEAGANLDVDEDVGNLREIVRDNPQGKPIREYLRSLGRSV